MGAHAHRAPEHRGTIAGYKLHKTRIGIIIGELLGIVWKSCGNEVILAVVQLLQFRFASTDQTNPTIADTNGLFKTTPQLEYFFSLRTRYVLCICKEAIALLRSLHTEADVDMWKSEGAQLPCGAWGL